MSKYHMNKQEREIASEKELFDILKNGKFMSLALCRDNQPYLVTLSYGFDEAQRIIYFHVASKGLKLDIIRENALTCATVVEDHGYVKTDCTQKYRSLVLWGDLEIVNDLQEAIHGFNVIFDHLEGPNSSIKAKFKLEESDMKEVCILKLAIKNIEGKGNL